MEQIGQYGLIPSNEIKRSSKYYYGPRKIIELIGKVKRGLGKK